MVAKIEFKQQCPSCEAMVPVRDRKLIGRKIDCPKCKYRFVVEDPEAEEAEEAEEESPGKKKSKNGSTAITTKPRPGKSKLGKGKGDDDEGRPKKKTADSKRTLYMGLALGMVALVVLGLVGFLVIGGDDPTKPKGSTPKGQGPGQPQIPDLKLPDQQPAPPPAIDVTNLLPNNTEAVISVNVPRLLESLALVRTLFEGPGGTPGGFSREGFARTFGFGLDKVKRLLLASNESEGWEFSVINVMEAVSLDDLKKKLALKPAKDSPIRGLEYFQIGAELDPLSRWFFNSLPRELTLTQIDDNTLVLASVVPMQKFLDAKARPAHKAQPPGAGAPPPPAPPPPQPGQPPAPPAPPGPTGSYLTIEPMLKVLLDQMEQAPEPVILSRAAMPSRKVSIARQVADLLWLDVLPSGQQLKDVQAVAAALEAWKAEKVPYTVAVECLNDEVAKNGEKLLREKAGPELVKMIKERTGVAAVLTDEQGNVPAGMEPKGDEKISKIVISTQGKTLRLKLDLAPDQPTLDAVKERLQPEVILRKGRLEMSGSRSRLHELAAAVKAYADKHKAFPRGALERRAGAERGGLPWRPEQRLSWMVELLPHLGRGEFGWMRERIDSDRSWRDRENWLFAFTPIPQFLTAGSPENSWWIYYPGLSEPVAATHFAGIAGVGLDAADPSFATLVPDAAKKIGVFGYDRVTRLEDITDGPANTIVLLQVPFYYKTPWMAGGGSTVRGVPETASVRPFVCTEHGGKPGTFAIMADGQVRFIPEDIPDDVFKALCTIAGGEKIDNLDAIAPVVPGMKTELRPVVPSDKPKPPAG